MIILLFVIIVIGFFMIKSISHKKSHDKSEKNLGDAYKTVWGKEIIAEFEDNLGLKSEERTDQDCPYDRHIISAIVWPDQSIENYVWSYFTLYSLSLNELYLKPVITKTLRQQLIKLFEEVDMPVINNVPRKCFELKSAVVLEYNMEVNEVAPITTPYLLAEHGKRWNYLMNLDSQVFRSKFGYKETLLMELRVA